MEPPVITGKPPAAKDWRCGGCNALLGKKHSHGILVIKYKDSVTEVSGDYIAFSYCRRCNLPNTISAKSHGLLSLLEDKERKE